MSHHLRRSQGQSGIKLTSVAHPIRCAATRIGARADGLSSRDQTLVRSWSWKGSSIAINSDAPPSCATEQGSVLHKSLASASLLRFGESLQAHSI